MSARCHPLCMRIFFDPEVDALWATSADWSCEFHRPAEGLPQVSGMDFDSTVRYGPWPAARAIADVLVTIEFCNAQVTEQAELMGSVMPFFCGDGDLATRHSDGTPFLHDCNQLYTVDQMTGLVRRPLPAVLR